MNDILKIFLAVIVVMLFAEVSPEAVNAVLILVVVGMLLGRWQSFAQLFNYLGGNKKK